MTTSSSPFSLLSVRHLHMQFGGLVALSDLDFDAYPEKITAIIGPNGAGKTTLFNCITGFYKPSSGSITLTHSDSSVFHLEKLPDFKACAHAKVARTFQNIRLFPQMTVLENLLMAQHNKLMRASGYSFKGLLGLHSYKQAENQAVDQACYWLDRMKLTHKADLPVAGLPYGEQRQIEIARAMCTDPKLLCLDEPAAGLNPAETKRLSALIQSIRDEFKIGILLIEHDMGLVMDISDKIIVLDYGEKICDDTPENTRCNAAVIKAYLGEEQAEALPDIVQHDLEEKDH